MVPELWRRNLYVIAIAEFIVLTAFSFVTPFMPLFVQQLGNFTNHDAAFWAGIATGSAGIAMFLSSPLWGIVADRWGRKPMVLRAQFGSGIVLALAGLSPNVYYLIGLRFAQGLLSGTLAAASALVSAMTPRDKFPFAMGLLMIAFYAGNTLGPLLGGLMADAFGFQITFFITGALLLLGGLIVMFFVKENFERPARGQAASLGGMLRVATSRDILPLLIVACALSIGPQMVSPILPLRIKELGSTGSAASAAGLAFAVVGIMAAVSSLVASRLAKRISLKRILVFSCVGTGLLYLPPIWAASVAQLIIFMGTSGLMVGGIVVSSSSLVGLSVPLSQQGVAYGLSQSATSLGNGLGPLIGGSLASAIGLRLVFGVTGGIFVLVSLLVITLLVKRPSEK
jgi:DHA1 family multidrug resistance protein-like MFS transporter